jgi:Sulfotransferase domain
MLKVIGSGFGRTGTLSMKAALEQLGFGPCYHMREVFPKHVAAWHKVGLGLPVDWHELFKGYQSSVDFPACIYYRELMQAFPVAKVVHTVRDPQRWYQSAYETIYRFTNITPPWARRLIRPIGRQIDMVNLVIWGAVFKGEFENRERAIDIFRQHTEEVLRTVPPERLLVFDVKDGWEPLCKFLQVPIPDTPFPHLNDGEHMQRMMSRMLWLFRWGPVVLGAVVLAVIGVIAGVSSP